MGSGDSLGISGPEWGRFEAKILAFEQAWLRGERPSIDLYIDDVEAGARQDLLIELVHTELECRLKANDPARVEEYLEKYPELSDSDEIVLELIRAEWSFRKRRDPKLSRQQYIQRFPGFHQLLPASTEETPTISSLSSVALSGLRMPPASDFALPRRLGKFELRQKIGEGSFAIVYKAWDTFLKREIAIKIPRPQAIEDRQDIRNFLREARNTIHLRHPNIVAIHDAGPIDGIICIVRAYIDGITLDEQIRIAPLAPEEAAAIITVVAEALEYAHNQGIVHRDLKPSNILIDQQGQPYVSDFGLARHSPGDSTLFPGKTADAMIGTPAYMSPEQARGNSQSVDRRSDLFSLGVIFYQLLAGALPFQGRGPILTAQIENLDPPPPSTLNEDVTPDLERVCLKALSKNPEDRYQTAQELADDLRNYLGGHRVEPRTRRPQATKLPRRRLRIAPFAIPAVLTACSILTALFWWRSEARRRNDVVFAEVSYRAFLDLARPDRAVSIGGEPLIADLWLEASKIAPLLESDPTLLGLAAEAQLKLAERATARGADQQAEGHWKKVIEFSEQLLQKNPLSFLHRRNLANALKHLAAIRGRANDLVGSKQLTERSIEVWQKIIEQKGKETVPTLDEMEAQLGVAQGELELRRASDLSRLLEIQSELDNPPSVTLQDRARLAGLEVELASLLLRLAMSMKSMETATTALQLFESLGNDFEGLAGSAQALMVLALASHDLEHGAVAKRFSRQAISLYESLRRNHAESPDLRKRLASAAFELGRLQSQSDCGRDAISSYRKALELRLGLAREEPEGATNWLAVAEVRSALALEPAVPRIARVWLGFLTIVDRLRVQALGPGIVENRRELANLMARVIVRMERMRPWLELHGLVRATVASVLPRP